MPDYTRAPDYRDVELLMRSAGYWPSDKEPQKQALAREQAAAGAGAAVAEWCRRTGWTPFQVAPDAAMTAREFEWDGNPVLQLDGGILQLGGVTIDGQAADAQLYRPLPQNALANGRPYQALKWQPHYARMRQARIRGGFGPIVEITARWGYCTVYPGDAWQQILQAAGLVTLTQIENLQSIASISQEGFSKAFDVVGILTQKDTADRWRKEFPAACERYKRMVA